MAPGDGGHPLADTIRPRDHDWLPSREDTLSGAADVADVINGEI